MGIDDKFLITKEWCELQNELNSEIDVGSVHATQCGLLYGLYLGFSSLLNLFSNRFFSFIKTECKKKLIQPM